MAVSPSLSPPPTQHSHKCSMTSRNAAIFTLHGKRAKKTAVDDFNDNCHLETQHLETKRTIDHNEWPQSCSRDTSMSSGISLPQVDSLAYSTLGLSTDSNDGRKLKYFICKFGWLNSSGQALQQCRPMLKLPPHLLCHLPRSWSLAHLPSSARIMEAGCKGNFTVLRRCSVIKVMYSLFHFFLLTLAHLSQTPKHLIFQLIPSRHHYHMMQNEPHL
jgi:hypothetical protein